MNNKKENKLNSFPILTLDREDLREYLGIQNPDDIDDVTMADIAEGMMEWFLNDFSQALLETATAHGICEPNC